MAAEAKKKITKKAFEQFESQLKFSDQGLIPAVIQDAETNEVLTLCYLNRDALRKSLEEGKVYVFRRSKGRLMLKGESSGHTQTVKQVLVDCEGKSLVIRVRQKVAACHAGYYTCYYRRMSKDGTLKKQGKMVFDPDKVYKS